MPSRIRIFVTEGGSCTFYGDMAIQRLIAYLPNAKPSALEMKRCQSAVFRAQRRVAQAIELSAFNPRLNGAIELHIVRERRGLCMHESAYLQARRAGTAGKQVPEAPKRPIKNRRDIQEYMARAGKIVARPRIVDPGEAPARGAGVRIGIYR